MYSTASQMNMLSRNIQPVVAGSKDDGPLPFSRHHHDIDNPLSPVLAIARVGGEGGPVYVYSEEQGATFGGGGRRADTETQRDSPTPYLFASSPPALSRSFSPGSDTSITVTGSIAIGNPSSNSTLVTPHSSVSDTYIPPSSAASSATLSSSPFWSVHPKALIPTSAAPITPSVSITPRSHPPALTHLLSALFPTHHPSILASCHALEIVTPPSHTLHGFLTDTPSLRTAFIHLPPPHSSSSRPEHLSANFSEVLRPHDPERGPRPSALSSLADGLDIRESLTALLDLAADSLEAGRLVLILDKRERGEEGVRELVYSLGYAGGAVIRPGGMEGGWAWDPKRWVMVGMDL